MIACDAATFCPSPAEIAYIVEQSVDDRAFPDPLPRKKPVASRESRGPADLPKWIEGNWSRFSVSVQRSALCIAHHESWGTHNGRRLWTALNLAGSTASGFAQWIDSSWQVQAKRAGIGTQYRRAVYAPAEIQAAVFAYQATNFGLYPWEGTQCPGT
jgi:hypothetical protein